MYCSTPTRPLTFSTTTPPWVALPVEDYQSGAVQCGDLIHLRFENGATLTARAYDAGPFSRYCVEQPDGSCPSIDLDVPNLHWPAGEDLSAPVEYVNLSQVAREWGMRD